MHTDKNWFLIQTIVRILKHHQDKWLPGRQKAGEERRRKKKHSQVASEGGNKISLSFLKALPSTNAWSSLTHPLALLESYNLHLLSDSLLLGFGLHL